MSCDKSWTSQAHSRWNIIETTKSFLVPQRGWSCLFCSNGGIDISTGIHRKWELFLVIPFPVVKQLQFTSAAARLKVHLLCVMCVQGELESAEDLTGERGSEGGVQTQSRRWERRGLCCTHVPHMNSKHRIHHGTCSPWIIYFSISKHLEAVRSTSQACCGCVGILAQNPSWLHIDHFSLGSSQCKYDLGLYAHFPRDTDVAGKEGHITTLDSQNLTSCLPCVLSDALPASLHSHLESHSWSCTYSCCYRLHVSTSPCFSVQLERGPGWAWVFWGTSENQNS